MKGIPPAGDAHNDGRTGVKKKSTAWTLTAAALLVAALLPGGEALAGWGEVMMVETSDTALDFPHVDVFPSGGAVAVWPRGTLENDDLWSSRWDPGTGWTAPELIEEGDGDVASRFPVVAADGSGSAFAAWAQDDGTDNSIWVNRYDPGTGWGTPQMAESNGGHALYPDLAADGSGSAVVVWTQDAGAGDSVWANRYDPVSGWGGAEVIGPAGSGAAVAAQVGMDGSGNAFAVWSHEEAGVLSVWASRCDGAGGWGPAELIEDGDASVETSPQVAVDGSGAAVAVWSQTDGAAESIWSNRYEPAVGWGTAEALEATAGAATNPSVSVDGAGAAVAAWSHTEGSDSNIWTSRYLSAAGWSAPELAETVPGDCDNPQVAVDGAGNAVAVWNRLDETGTVRVWANRYIDGFGWGVAEMLHQGNGSSNGGRVAFDSAGNALVIWKQWDGFTYHIMAVVDDFSEPAADIKANGSDTPVTISEGDPLEVAVSLKANGLTGADVDYWLIAETPLPVPGGWFHYRPGTGWVAGQGVTFQSPCVDVSGMSVLLKSTLPPGRYVGYFGVDTNQNGKPDFDDLHYDVGEVTILP